LSKFIEEAGVEDGRGALLVFFENEGLIRGELCCE
jgi:hypothetical protein